MELGTIFFQIARSDYHGELQFTIVLKCPFPSFSDFTGLLVNVTKPTPNGKLLRSTVVHIFSSYCRLYRLTFYNMLSSYLCSMCPLVI